MGIGAAAPVAAQDRWAPIAVSGADTVFVDTDNIRLVGPQQWQAWTKWWFAAERDVPVVTGKRFKYALMHMQIDCVARVTRNREVMFYHQTGEVVQEGEPRADWPAWDGPVPESLGEMTQRGFCRYVAR